MRLFTCTNVQLSSQQNSNSFAWPKRTPTGVETKPCTNRPNTHWIGDKSGKEELRWKAKKTAFKQRPYISVERPESHHQLQDPSPQHWGQSTTDWRPEQFFTVGSKTKACLTPHTHSDHPTTQPSTPSPSPSPTVSQPVIKICEEDVSKVFRRQKIRKAKAQTLSLQPASKPVLFSYHPSSHWSSIDHWSCVKSPPASNAPPSSLYPRNQKSQDLMTTDLLL